MAAGSQALNPRRRPRQQRSRQTVEFVLEAAAQVFASHGYAGATTNHIAERAGVSVGTLYQYFPNKDAILLALAERHVEEAARGLAATAMSLRAAEPDLDELVRVLVTATADLNADPVHAVLFDEAPRTPDLAGLLRRLRRTMAEEVEGHLARLGRGGDRPDLIAEYLVLSVDAAVHEVVIRYPSGPDRDAAVAELCSFVQRAVPAPEPSEPSPA